MCKSVLFHRVADHHSTSYDADVDSLVSHLFVECSATRLLVALPLLIPFHDKALLVNALTICRPTRSMSSPAFRRTLICHRSWLVCSRG